MDLADGKIPAIGIRAGQFRRADKVASSRGLIVLYDFSLENPLEQNVYHPGARLVHEYKDGGVLAAPGMNDVPGYSDGLCSNWLIKFQHIRLSSLDPDSAVPRKEGGVESRQDGHSVQGREG